MDADDAMFTLLDIFRRPLLKLGEEKTPIGNHWYMLPWEKQLQSCMLDANVFVDRPHGTAKYDNQMEG